MEGLKECTLILNNRFVSNWARCLPNWGTLLAHHGQRACPGWAELLSDKCPISSCCNTHISVFRILQTHSIPVFWIPLIWQSPSSANHPDSWLTVARQSTPCLSGYYDKKNQMVWQFLGNSWFYWESAIWATFAHIDQLKIIPSTGLPMNFSPLSFSPEGEMQVTPNIDNLLIFRMPLTG